MKAKKYTEETVSLIISPNEMKIIQKYHQIDINPDMILKIHKAYIGEVGEEVKVIDQYNRITINNEDYFQTG